MFSKILTTGLFAGFAAGLIAAVLQFVFVQPVLLHAELYESGVLAHFNATGPNSAHPDLGGLDVMRDGLSVLFTVLIYSGYALILAGAMAMASDRGQSVTPRAGVLGTGRLCVCAFYACNCQPPNRPATPKCNECQRG